MAVPFSELIATWPSEQTPDTDEVDELDAKLVFVG
jgi:hypothetical protein